MLCILFMNCLNGEGASTLSNERLMGPVAGVAVIVPLMEVEASRLDKSNAWQNIDVEVPSRSTYQSETSCREGK